MAWPARGAVGIGGVGVAGSRVALPALTMALLLAATAELATAERASAKEAPGPAGLPPVECVDAKSGAMVVPDAEIVSVGRLDEPPVVIERVAPEWPPGRHRLGVVVIESVIDRSGAVCAVRVLKAPEPELGAAAAAALRRWRFSPGKVAGRPVAVRHLFTVNLHPGH